ncbi:MAG: hypothetical protein CMJ44_12445 [Pimelobacter sp.]|nr:hypothetical protein [Pimelobacter sp.]MAS55408.1 hypothetical protein [Pimelobacter sp.]
MTSSRVRHRPGRRSGRFLAVAGLLGTLGAPLPAAPARAEGRVTVANEIGTAQADVRYRTELTVRGSGFQVVQGGFGGVYVMFGWVRDPAGGSWRPSRGGLTGQDYQYIPDSEDAAANAGYLRFLAFPGGATAAEANGELSASGGFSVELTVPGPVFESVDRTGNLARVDCREVRCGVITIGAHGVANARNESFTPVAFGEVLGSAPSTPSPTGPTASPEASPTSDVTTDASTDTSTGRRTRTPARRSSAPLLAVDRASAVPGRALIFTAQGFRAGEQVVAVLDDGRAAVGPLTAGASGEVASALQLPTDLAPGTHELRLSGAASGTEVGQRFAALLDPGAVPTSTSAADVTAGGSWAATSGAVFLAVGAGAFTLAALRYGVLLARRRRRAPAAGVA